MNISISAYPRTTGFYPLDVSFFSSVYGGGSQDTLDNEDYEVQCFFDDESIQYFQDQQEVIYDV